jgi:hypothetical protein
LILGLAYGQVHQDGSLILSKSEKVIKVVPGSMMKVNGKEAVYEGVD